MGENKDKKPSKFWSFIGKIAFTIGMGVVTFQVNKNWDLLINAVVRWFVDGKNFWLATIVVAVILGELILVYWIVDKGINSLIPEEKKLKWNKLISVFNKYKRFVVLITFSILNFVLVYNLLQGLKQPIETSNTIGKEKEIIDSNAPDSTATKPLTIPVSVSETLARFDSIYKPQEIKVINNTIVNGSVNINIYVREQPDRYLLTLSEDKEFKVVVPNYNAREYKNSLIQIKRVPSPAKYYMKLVSEKDSAYSTPYKDEIEFNAINYSRMTYEDYSSELDSITNLLSGVSNNIIASGYIAQFIDGLSKNHISKDQDIDADIDSNLYNKFQELYIEISNSSYYDTEIREQLLDKIIFNSRRLNSILDEK